MRLDAPRATYTHAAAGNRLQKEEPSAAATDYTWDEDNRLTLAEPPVGDAVTMTYNADGRRARKTAGADDTKFIYDYRRVLQETDASDTTETLYTNTVEEYGDLVSEYDTSAAASSYHHYDALGSTDALADADEDVDDRFVYRAFGQLESHTGSSVTPFTFVGKQNYQRDPEIALYYLDARHYDPATGQ